MGVINLAHGSFYMAGAYLAFGLAPLFGGNFLSMLAGLGAAVARPSAILTRMGVLFSFLYEREHLSRC